MLLEQPPCRAGGRGRGPSRCANREFVSEAAFGIAIISRWANNQPLGRLSAIGRIISHWAKSDSEFGVQSEAAFRMASASGKGLGQATEGNKDSEIRLGVPVCVCVWRVCVQGGERERQRQPVRGWRREAGEQGPRTRPRWAPSTHSRWPAGGRGQAAESLPGQAVTLTGPGCWQRASSLTG